jgi:hypothetical protein
MEKTKKSLGLGLVGFNEQQKGTLLAILALAERRLEYDWQVVDLPIADFFLLSTEKSQSESLIIEKKLPTTRCLFCTEQNLQTDNEIMTDAKKIPRLGSLVDILNQIANTQPVSIDDDFFDPEQVFLKHLLQPTPSEFFLCSFSSPSGSYKLYADLVGKVYYCQAGLKELGICLGIEEAIAIHVVSPSEWNDFLERAALPARPLNNLIWYVAYKLSNGRLLRGHLDQDCVYLTRWPDLGIQDCGRYVKLAAFMRHNAVCLTEVAEKTAMPLADVYNFYNACYLIGIVEKTDQPESHTKIFDESKQQLLTKITNRLRDINNYDER